MRSVRAAPPPSRARGFLADVIIDGHLLVTWQMNVAPAGLLSLCCIAPQSLLPLTMPVWGECMNVPGWSDVT